jgi:hypothetical protein
MITIDKQKAIKKWKPILDSLNIIDVRKIETLSIFGEYRNFKINNRSIISSPTTIYGGGSNNISTLSLVELKILSNVDLNNKIVIMSGLNDDKIYFVEPNPVFKYSVSFESFESIKKLRKDKINVINGNSVVNTSSVVHRLEQNMSTLISSDINCRLKEGDILYIDEELVSEININRIGNRNILEYSVRFDIV